MNDFSLLRTLFFLVFISFVGSLLAQSGAFTVRGSVYDAQTLEPLSFVSVALVGQNIGTYTDDFGMFELKIKANNPQIRISSVGYKDQTLDVNATQAVADYKIALESKNLSLKEVVIQETKYKNKNNPAVELIKVVVENRDKNRVQNFDSYKVEQYEKVLMGFSNLSEKFRNRRVFRSIKFALDNIDTTKLAGIGVTPIFLQESLQDYYVQTNPDREKTLINTTQKVRFPLLDDEGLDKYVRLLYQDVDLYENTITMFTDEFLSPIANNAWLFYRYYPSDTLEVDGSKVIRLQFFPRNKLDKLFQGNLYIALDSTFAVTKIDFTVNPQINLNWVRTLEAEQVFKKIPNTRQWVLSEESYQMDFGVFSKGSGIFGERYLSHRAPQMGIALPDSVFDKKYEVRTVVDGAEINADERLAKGRHLELNATEARTYAAVDSIQKTKFFKRTTQLIQGLVIGFWKPTPGIEIGRLNTIYSFNPVEGTRLRFGGRTNPLFSKRANFEAYGAYGIRDKRWKMGIATNISLSKRPYNRFPYNLLRISYIKDLKTPGVVPIGTFDPTSIATSFTRGTNDRFFFQKRFFTQYQHEFPSRFEISGGFEHLQYAPLGSLSFKSVDDTPTPDAVTTARPFIMLRYAPGEEFYETNNGWRQRIRFKAIFTLKYQRNIPDIFGSEYSYDEWHASMYKLSKLGILGKNYLFIEGGYVNGKVPYPFLTVHRANQTFGYRFMAYNLMNFMEFVSDKYAAVHIEHQFQGFFLNKIPLVRRLKFREYVTFKMIYGEVSKRNQPVAGSDLFEFPKFQDGTRLTYTLNNGPYIEASVGVGNIFKIIRLDVVRRFSYLDNPNVTRIGVRIAAHAAF